MRWSTQRSTPASRSSTPPTSTATRAAARSCSAASCRGAATRSCSPRSSARRWGTAPSVAARGATSGRRSKHRCARLQTERVDLYQHHEEDTETPLEETIGALDELVAEGKIRAYGTSNYRAATLERAKAIGSTAYVSEQSEYSWLRREAEAEVIPACERLGLGLHPVLPARERPADRQGLARMPRRRKAPACTAGRSTTPTSTASSASEPGPRLTARRCSTSPSAVSPPSRRSHR